MNNLFIGAFSYLRFYTPKLQGLKMAQRAERKKFRSKEIEESNKGSGEENQLIKNTIEVKPFKLEDKTVYLRKLIKENISPKHNHIITSEDEFKLKNKYLGKKGLYAIDVIENVFVFNYSLEVELNKLIAKNQVQRFPGVTTNNNCYFKEGFNYIIPIYSPIINNT